MTDPTICDVFDQLDRDRHLAGYRLEERASPYFRQFLPEVLEKHCDAPINPIIIPEFPFSKEDGTNRSPKVDFFAMSADGTRCFLIELKTDMGSLDTTQIDQLVKAAGRKLCDILDGIKSMAQTSDKQNRQKYFHILQALEDLKLIKMDSTLKDLMYADNSRGVYELIANIEIKCGDLKPKINYILPRYNDILGCTVITFEKFARVVDCRGELGTRFAKSLRCWAEVEAGSVPPGAK